MNIFMMIMYGGILFLIASFSFAFISWRIYQKNKKSKQLKNLYWARVISAILLTPYVFFQYIFSDLTYLPIRIAFVIFSLFILYLLIKRWGKEPALRRR
jgi:membrane protein implicated in regulation of membrane protease activity